MDLATALGTWSAATGPLHRKLADGLVAAIERGDLAPGERLPAERTLARSLAVSRSTVVAAYDHLRAEGWLESRQGSGTRVRWTTPLSASTSGRATIPGGSGDLIFRRLMQGPGSVISLAAAIVPGLPIVSDVAGSFTAAELDEMVRGSGYMPLGLPALRREIAAFLTRIGLPTASEQVLVTTGAQQAISLAASLLVSPGDAVLVENPSFSGCLDALRAAGARLVPVPVDEDGVDVDAFERLIDTTSPAAAYLMPTFHNPTGALLSESRRRRLARIAADRGLPIIEDNALQLARFRDSVPPPPIGSFAAEGAPVLTIGSLSKVLWAGLRVGWLRADEAMIGRLAHCKAVHDLGSPVFTQAMASRLIPRLDEVQEQRRRDLSGQLDRAQALMRERLPGWTWRPPEGGFALWVKLPVGDGGEFCQVGLRHGVEVVPGVTMSPDGSFTDHLRLAMVEEPLLDEAIARLSRAWAAYAPSDAVQRPQLRVIV